MASAMQQRGRDNRQAADQHQSEINRPGGGAPAGEGGPGGQTTITHHEDGSHSVQHADGEQTGPHANLHEAMAHVAQHSGDGMHHFTHHDGMGGGHKTHQTAHGGDVAAHDHDNLESVKQGMDQFFGEEEQEGHGDDGDEEGGSKPASEEY